MTGSRFSDFVPEWANQDNHDLDTLTVSGVEPHYAPRMCSRLIPEGNGHQVSVRTLVQTVNITQRLMIYAGAEAAIGIDMGLADLRNVRSEVQDMTRLTVEPFEEGSFVIPFLLPDGQCSIDDKIIQPRDVLDRFSQILQGVTTNDAFSTAIGAVQAVSELGMVLRRDSAVIEFSSVFNDPIRINSNSIDKATATLRRRRQPQQSVNEIEGVLTALDITKKTFKLRLESGNTVTGGFDDLAESTLRKSLGKSVQLTGVIEYESDCPQFVRAFFASASVELDDV